ncbi:hypothetical protein Scep_027246 [Stephania cephalantha]|uniref:Ribosomal protein S35, mitochondrial n=1 Tax=Stephania cephalantha TaxID=152367 RepID=A0AAP0EG07_9MAGN
MQSLNRVVPRIASTTPILARSAALCHRFSSSSSNSTSGSGSSSGGDGDGRSNGAAAGDWEKRWSSAASDPFSSSSSSSSASSVAAEGFGWDSVSSWSTGLTKDHFDGEVVGRQVSESGGGATQILESAAAAQREEEEDELAEMMEEKRRSKEYVESWSERMKEVSALMKQVREPGARGAYLKDSEKAEMYKLHKENPEVYTVERLAKDYRIMRQRVHAILWLKEIEVEEERKLGHALDDSIELLLDTCPEFLNAHDREFHVASLPYKPDFRVMPEGWDGTTRDPDEVHYEISMKEDEMLYQEFVQRMNFNKMKMAGEVKCHKYSRRRSSEGWNFTVEKMGPRGKRGGGGGWKFVSLPDGSSRPLNETEKMYVKRETVRRRRKLVHVEDKLLRSRYIQSVQTDAVIGTEQQELVDY